MRFKTVYPRFFICVVIFAFLLGSVSPLANALSKKNLLDNSSDSALAGGTSTELVSALLQNSNVASFPSSSVGFSQTPLVASPNSLTEIEREDNGSQPMDANSFTRIGNGSARVEDSNFYLNGGGGGAADLVDNVSDSVPYGSASAVFTETFEGAFPGDNWWVGDSNANSGSDYWLDTSYRYHGGSWSGYCAQYGTQSSDGQSNSVVHKYDTYMDAYMWKKYTVDMSTWDLGYVDFWAYYQTESSFDYMIAQWYGGSSWYDDANFKLTGTGTSWSRYYWRLPDNYLVSQGAFGFKFHSDGSINYEGVYVDDINLIRADVTLDNYYISPTSVVPGGTFTAYYYVNNPCPFSIYVGLGLSIRYGSTTYNDPAHDTQVLIGPGSSWVSRQFTVQGSAPVGLYDVIYGIHSKTPGTGGREWGYATSTAGLRILGYADLMWTDIYTEPSPPTGGQNSRIHCILKNQGTDNAAGSFTNQIYIDGVLRGSGTNNGLNAGSSYDWWLDITLGPGYHTLQARADVNNNIPEGSNEGNNQYPEVIWWKGPDLVITDIWWTDSYGTRNPAIACGQLPFNVYFQIKNNGDAYASGPFTTYMTVGSVTSRLYSHTGLDVGATTNCELLNVEATSLSPQDIVITVTVDYQTNVAEANLLTGSGIGTAESNNQRTATITVQRASWTIITYLSCGSQSGADLSSVVDQDIARIKEAGSSSQVSVVSLADKSGNGDSHAYFFIPGQTVDIPLSSINSGWSNEVDMGSTSTLVTFATYTINRFKANHYALILFDHGGDLYGAIGDDISFNIMGIDEIGDALQQITQNTGIGKLDIFGLDACLMGMTEMAYEIRNNAYVFVGSEKTEYPCPFTCLSPSSWRYNEFISTVRNTPTIDRYALATNIVDTYIDHWSGLHAIHSMTLSAVNLDQVDVENLATRASALADLLRSKMHLYHDQVEAARGETQHYDDAWVVDLYHLTQRLAAHIPDSAIQQACIDVQSALNSLIVRERHITSILDVNVDNSHGLTIWFADSQINDNSFRAWYGSSLDFGAKNWDEMLYAFWNNPNPNSAPVVAVVAPSTGVYWSKTQTIQWTGKDDNYDGVTYNVYVSTNGGSSWSTVSLGLRFDETPTVANHYLPFSTTNCADSTQCKIRIDYNDGFGGTGSAYSAIFTIDNTPPTTAINHSPGSSGFTFTSSDATSGVLATYYRVDGGSWIVYSGLFSVPVGTSHTIDYYSRDRAGNDEAIKSLTVYYVSMTTSYGSLSPGSGWYNSGSTITIGATVSAGDGEDYIWNGWTGSGPGSYTGTSNSASVGPITGPVTETASWTHKYRLIVSVSPTGTGYTNPNANTYWYDAGQPISVSAYANSGYDFDHWVLDSSNVGNQNPYPVQMTAPHGITAYFVPTGPNLYTVTFYTNPQSIGSILFSGSTYTNSQNGQYAGGTYSATANAPADYQLHHWEYGGSVTGPSTGNPASVQVSGAGWLKAVYSAKVTFYTVPAGVGSMTWGSDPQQYTNGQYKYDYSLAPEYPNTVSVSATVPPGYFLDHWESSWSLSATLNPIQVTFTGPGYVRAVYSACADGFESGSFSAWTGTSVSAGETASVVSTLSHHGGYSARFAANGGTTYEYTYCYRTVSALSEVYARGYFYVSQSGIAAAGNRFYLIQLKSGTGTVAWAGWRQISSGLRWELIIRNGAGYVSAFSSVSPSLNGWYCVELHWKKDNANGVGELFVDGVLVCSLTGKDTSAYGDVTAVRFGLPELQSCGPTTVNCDCCTISKSYIGIEVELLLEDGFESGNFGSWSGSFKTAGETALVVSALAHHGVYSAKFTSDGSTAYEAAYCYRTVSALSEVYARGYFYVSQSGIAAAGNRFYLIQLKSGTGTVAWAGWRQISSGLRWELIIRNGAGYVSAFSSVSPSLNGWYCVELHWKKGASGGADLWIDGTLTCSLAGKDTTAYGDVSKVCFGLPELESCGPTMVYCDCCVIDTRYIGKET